MIIKVQIKEVSKRFWKVLLAMGLSACWGFALPGVSQEMPQQVQFADQVTKTPLTRVGTAEQAQLNHRIHALEKKGEHLRALFTTQASGNDRTQVLFADHTPFQLRLSAGAHFAILDADARDGQASIQLPRGVLNTYFRLQGKKQNSSQLAIEEGLYHVKDVLNRTHWGHWMQWGARLLPIPQDWHNDGGESLVLQLQPTDLASFQMVWLAASETVPFPPGVNEIGPEGGVVELPGVATLNIPEGALDAPVIISMKQLMEAYEPGAVYLDEGTQIIYQKNFYSYASAVVELQPHGLTFHRPARIKLKNTKEWRHHSTILEVLSMKSKPALITSYEQGALLEKELALLLLATDIHLGNLNQPTISVDDFEYYIEHFSYVAKVFPSFLAP